MKVLALELLNPSPPKAMFQQERRKGSRRGFLSPYIEGLHKYLNIHSTYEAWKHVLKTSQLPF